VWCKFNPTDKPSLNIQVRAQALPNSLLVVGIIPVDLRRGLEPEARKVEEKQKATLEQH